MHATTFPDRPTALALIAGISAWFGAVFWAASGGALAVLGARLLPAYALLVAIGILAPTVVYFTVPRVRSVVDGMGLFGVTILHVWRVPAALVFFWYGLEGKLPAPFWVLAGVGDLAAGLLAATLWWRPRTAERYLAIHRFGFADFVVAVGTGLTFTLLADPRMSVLTELPMALIPLFGVGLSGAAHLVAFDMLRRGEAPSARAQ